MTSTGEHPGFQKSRYLWLFTLILVLAAVVRVAGFGDSPPGLQHDEMFKALEGRRLLEAGDFRVFYPTNQGHEGGYVWALAVSMALVGVNALAVKLPALAFGMVTVALTMRLTGRLLNRRAAAIAGGLSAVLFFAVFTSRVGLRAVMLPVFALWLLLALRQLTLTLRMRDAAIAGGALGLALYTYTSAFALWGGIAGLVLALAVTDRPLLKRLGRRIAAAAGIALIISVPMIAARVTDPEGFNRSSTITRPLSDALAGQPEELAQNALRLLGMAAFTGDPEARYNIPDQPLFPMPVGLLAYAGIGMLFLRLRRQPMNAAILGVLGAALVPSLVTVSAPSFLRSITALPLLIVCVAAAIDRLPRRGVLLVGAAAVGLTGVVDLRAYFVEWPNIAEVRAIYRDDLEQLAAAVRSSMGVWLASTPDVEQDALMFSLYAGAESRRVAFFDGDTAAAFKANGTLALSRLSPLTAPHATLVSTEGSEPRSIPGQDGAVAFSVLTASLSAEGEVRLSEAGARPVYVWPSGEFLRGDPAAWATNVGYPINFGDLVALAGVELSDRVLARDFDGVNLQLFLQPLVERSSRLLNVFVHVTRVSNGRLHAQRDLMGMPASQWIDGITIVQDNFVVMGPSRQGWYIVTMGVYDVVSGERLPVIAEDGAVLGDQVILGRVLVGE